MAIIYVRKSGNDANSGLTIPLAKLTINGANLVAVNGDTIDIGAGTFTESVKLCAVVNVTYRGAGMAQTIIVGNIANAGNPNVLLQDLRVNLVDYTNCPIMLNATYDNICTRVFFDASAAGTSSITGLWFANPAANPGRAATFSNCIFYKFLLAAIAMIPIDVGVKLKFYNCVFYKAASTANTFYWYNPPTYLYIRNCIWHLSNALLQSGSILNNQLTVFHDHNDFNAAFSTPPTFDSTELVNIDPLFIDGENGDFRLQATSPCIGKGTGALP